MGNLAGNPVTTVGAITLSVEMTAADASVPLAMQESINGPSPEQGHDSFEVRQPDNQTTRQPDGRTPQVSLARSTQGRRYGATHVGSHTEGCKCDDMLMRQCLRGGS